MKTAILNCAILTGGEGNYSYKKINIEDAQGEIEGGFISAIGHASTAAVLTTLLKKEIPANRIQFKQEVGQKAVVFSLNKRIEEGRILGREEIEEIGYNLFLMEKIN